ncbi:unnamed protein product [Musa acuminata subsp. malaccensis]|uniref:(wild Malaysian banana) hypothetical protein n=1 Tax=Musa acuminata subsp. malaccensis TaxID=214687 RepID=A0A8D7B8S9_MUSAM|nr:unnamed protein product [Musa acuminata subsp. malaccensis]
MIGSMMVTRRTKSLSQRRRRPESDGSYAGRRVLRLLPGSPPSPHSLSAVSTSSRSSASKTTSSWRRSSPPTRSASPGFDSRNYYADEHYLPTLLSMVDPIGTQDITFELPKKISSIDESYHVTSDEKKVVTVKLCLWNGMKRLCYLFARKFYPEALHNLMQLFSNYTLI